MNGSVSAPASSERSPTAVAVSEPADSPPESSWLARAGASDAPRSCPEPPPWAAVAFAGLPAALPEPEAPLGAAALVGPVRCGPGADRVGPGADGG